MWGAYKAHCVLSRGLCSLFSIQEASKAAWAIPTLWRFSGRQMYPMQRRAFMTTATTTIYPLADLPSREDGQRRLYLLLFEPKFKGEVQISQRRKVACISQHTKRCVRPSALTAIAMIRLAVLPLTPNPQLPQQRQVPPQNPEIIFCHCRTCDIQSRQCVSKPRNCLHWNNISPYKRQTDVLQSSPWQVPQETPDPFNIASVSRALHLRGPHPRSVQPIQLQLSQGPQLAR